MSHRTQPRDANLRLDEIIELGITTNGKNKNMFWEGMPNPTKHASGASPLSDELATGKPFFATAQHVKKELIVKKLSTLIESKVQSRSKKISRKSNNFMNRCFACLGSLSTMLYTCNSLMIVSDHRIVNEEDNEHDAMSFTSITDDEKHANSGSIKDNANNKSSTSIKDYENMQISHRLKMMRNVKIDMICKIHISLKMTRQIKMCMI